MSQWYKCKCTICGREIHQNRCEILQPEIFVCRNCMENARQMLAIKNFAKDVSVKIDFGMIQKSEIQTIKASFDLMEVKQNG